MADEKTEDKPKAKPKAKPLGRLVMVNPRNVAKRQSQGYTLAPDYKGANKTEQRALDAGDPVAMRAPVE